MPASENAPPGESIAKAGFLQQRAGAPSDTAASRCVLLAELDSIINQGTAEYLKNAIERVETKNCELLLLLIDSPGGTLDATRNIVRMLLSANVPVVAYVAPSGARSGSAAMFITLATHIAVMAPGTTIGAAHPVLATGQDPEEAGGKELAKKIENDTASFARAIAKQRNRNAKWAEAAVRESVSVTATEAVSENVVDQLAPSIAELLSDLDGRSLKLRGRTAVLSTASAELIPIEMTLQQRALAVLGTPNIMYALFMLGVFGFMLELYSPGMWIGAGVGIVSFVLAAIGMNMLPVNWGGIVLLALASALFVAEIFVTSYGLLGLGGFVLMLIGSVLLIDRTDPDFLVDPNVRVTMGVVIPLAVVLSGASVAIAFRARRSSKRQSATGPEGLVGVAARALTRIDEKDGRVRCQGELWEAISDEPVEPGENVNVVSVDGLTLHVRRKTDTSRTS